MVRPGSVPRVVSPVVAASICLFASLLSSVPEPAAADASRLVVGEVVERELPEEQPDVFFIETPGDAYVEVLIECTSGEVTAKLFTPDGQPLHESGNTGLEPLSTRIATLAGPPGSYRLEIVPGDPRAPRHGRCAVTLAQQRPAAPDDAGRIAARGLVVDGTALLARATGDEDRKAAIAKLEQALPLWRSLADPVGEGETLDAIVEGCADVGDTKKATDTADQALAVWRRTGLRREEGRALSRVGLAAYSAYDKAKAVESYLAALAIHQEVGDRRWEGETLNRLGWYYRWVGDLRQALEYYERALPLRIAAGDWRGESVTLSDMGRIHYELGDVAAAVARFEESLALTPVERDPGRVANILVRMGSIYNATGEYQKALEIYSRAREAASRANDKRVDVSAMHNLAIVYENLGDWSSAQALYEQVLEPSQTMGLRIGEASALSGLARVHRNAGALERAVGYAQQALALSRENKDPAGETGALRTIGLLELEQHHDAQAVTSLNQALALSRQIGLRHAEAATLNLLATAHARLGDLAKARDESSAALEIARVLRASELESRTLSLLARWSLAAGDRSLARRQIEEAVRISESLRRSFTRRDWQSSYFATIQDKYALYIEILLAGAPAESADDDTALALEISESARARSLLDLLAESSVDLREGVDPDLLKKERALRQRVHFKASEQDRLLGGKQTEAQSEEIAKQLETLTAELRAVEAQVRASSPRYASLTQPRPLTAAEIQKQLLDADTVLLEFALGERRSWLFAVTSSSLSSFELPPREKIEKLARGVYDALTARQPRKGESGDARARRVLRADAQFGSDAAALSDMLLSGVAARLAGDWRGKRLVIVAPGALEYVPFAALPEPAGRKDGARTATRPLLAGREIVSLPSASVLASVRRETAGRPAPHKQVAVFADPVFEADDPRILSTRRVASALQPAAAVESFGARGGLSRLPFSREEATTIASMVPAGSLLQATDFAASLERALSEELGRFRIVHFATHGLLNTEHPELSGLVFSLFDERGKAQDGFLRLNEIYNHRLPADLVVLSACQTALGKEVRGEGLVGLTRGFMYAGARRVVASLWRVDDLATSELMRLFYRGMLVNGMRPAAALRAAQVEMSRQKRWSSPYYWAGFVIEGEWN